MGSRAHTGDLYGNSRQNFERILSEYIAVSEKGLIKAPANLSPEEISTLPIAAISAWEGLYNVGKVKSGDTVLLLGTGGVSIFGLQFAKASGARVIITSGSDEKLDKARALGADYTINYKNDLNWHQKVLEYTNGEGVDIALDVVGAELAKTAKAVRVGGSIAVIGLVGGAIAELNIIDLLQRPVKIEIVEGASKVTFYEMNKAIEQNDIKPVIDKVFHVTNTREAFEYASAGQHFGKVVVSF
jgi:NADPH:quinone reductase-like Zn-dependent oxidoreductase